jgi:hypothetical protein
MIRQTLVNFWIGDVRRGRKGLSDEKRPESTPALALLKFWGQDRKGLVHDGTQTRSLFEISPQTGVIHLRDCLGMKCLDSRWVPHTLNEAQKVNSVSDVHEMLRVLDNNG